jgi:hypothetical protein
MLGKDWDDAPAHSIYVSPAHSLPFGSFLPTQQESPTYEPPSKLPELPGVLAKVAEDSSQ